MLFHTLVALLSLFLSTLSSPLGNCPVSITTSPSPIFNRSLTLNYNNDMGYYFTFFSNFAYCYNNTQCDPQTCQFMALPSHIQVYWSLIIPTPSYSLRMVFLLDSKNKAIITSFAGTEGIVQLLEELLGSGLSDSGLHEEAPDIFPSGIQIVDYFQNNLLLIVKQFYRVYNSLLMSYPNYDHYYTGHSLGGAFASILGMISAAGNQELSGKNLLVTIGQPGVGNNLYAYFVDHFLINYRLVYHEDPVTYVPSWTTHHGTEVWYNENCGLFTCGLSGICSCLMCKSGDYSLCSESLGPQLGISDHSKYFEVLKYGFCGNTDSTYQCYN